jgi:hypothetical protein
MAEVGGIRRQLHCPRCSALNGLGSVFCRVCRVDLTPVDRLPPESLNQRCPHCFADNPQPSDLNRAVFCLGCGREIHFPGQSRLIGLTDLAATPALDVCPRCRQKGRLVAELHQENPTEWLGHLFAPPSRPWILTFGESVAARGDQAGPRTAEADSRAPALALAPPVGSDQTGRVELLVRRLLWRLGVGGLRTYRRQKLREYRAALDRWSRAHYCTTDAIVFVRWGTAVNTSSLRYVQRWFWAGDYP